MVPYVFGAHCIKLNDEKDRIGWKDAGNRTSEGIFVGIRGTSYMVYKFSTGKIAFEPFIWCLDEDELARVGTPAGGMVVEAEQQTDETTEFRPLPKPTPVTKTSIVVQANKDPLPKGFRLKVRMLADEGDSKYTWYNATATGKTAMQRGRTLGARRRVGRRSLG